MCHNLRNQRGMAAAAIAMAMAAFIGFAVVGVDIARLAFTATEVQTLADVAATAGARALYDGQPVVGQAQTAAAQNKVDGQPGAINPPGSVVVGHYDFTSATFSPGGTPSNAVQANAERTVNNFVAAALGNQWRQTKVEKMAIAPVSGPAQGCVPPTGCSPNDWACYCSNGTAPCLPIGVPDSCFDDLNSLPPLMVAPGGTAAWTSFGDNSTSANTVRPYLDQGPCQASGGGGTPGEQDVGASRICVSNGINPQCSAQGNVFGLMQCIVDNRLGCADTDGDGTVDAQGGLIFTIPVFDFPTCDANTPACYPLLGFATVEITGMVCDGSTKQVSMRTIARDSDTPPRPGGGCFSTDCRVMLAK